MIIRERPLLTDMYFSRDEFVPEADTAYVFATSDEDRSAHSPEWEAQSAGVTFVRIVTQHAGTFDVVIGDEEFTVSLRSGRELQAFWRRLDRKLVYLDITGLGHQVWAPLVRAATFVGQQVAAVYVEPAHYRFSKAPTEGEIFDLSERILGIDPIPGFVSLMEVEEEEDVCFIPLLGFEGTRLAYLVEQVQPPGDRIVPVVGVPGFKPEYPFYTFQGNRSTLSETRSWRKVRYAIANCPFSLFNLLEDVASEYPSSLLKIAPIGTKPHALGAVLYALAGGRSVELVYDHPIRKAHRTEGSSRLLVYHISTFIGG